MEDTPEKPATPQTPDKVLTPAARRALAEAAARRAAIDAKIGLAAETGGPKGPEPTRYGDWERNGRTSDF
ncbi:DUF1674 domain-containing protein [Maricaulis sp.]|uniref:DUF1674 domain-containing protein n=1 Tax=Maricaulis sp. TaxID=1486257 RepID=UPI003A8D0F49